MTSTPVTTSTTGQFLAQRDEWVALGRPVDHPYANAAAELSAQPRPTWVGPLVVFA